MSQNSNELIQYLFIHQAKVWLDSEPTFSATSSQWLADPTSVSGSTCRNVSSSFAHNRFCGHCSAIYENARSGKNVSANSITLVVPTCHFCPCYQAPVWYRLKWTIFFFLFERHFSTTVGLGTSWYLFEQYYSDENHVLLSILYELSRLNLKRLVPIWYFRIALFMTEIVIGKYRVKSPIRMITICRNIQSMMTPSRHL